MDIFKGNQERFGLTVQAQVAFLVIVSLFLWTIGAPALLHSANAANLTSISDTLTTSNLSTLAGHSITFTSNAAITGGQTIKISLDAEPSLPGTSAFTQAYSSATSTDMAFYANGSTYAIVSSCTAGNQVTAVGNYNTGSDENLTFTLCAGAATIPASAPVLIGISTTTASTKLWTNPSTAGSYPIKIAGTQSNSGETRVAVLQNITLTASVATSFTFTVTGLATTTGFYQSYATTTASTSPTRLPFSTLASSTGAVVLGQQLNVSTNARNGFSVTVQENQPPTSSTGATIDLFNNGATSSTPIPWTHPTAQLDVPSTYGHFGVTSDDTDLNTNEFGTSTKWAGNIDQPRVIFSHTGPSDGTTQNKGKASVGFKIQVSDLQEAGDDYTNTITYVATPTF